MRIPAHRGHNHPPPTAEAEDSPRRHDPNAECVRENETLLDAARKLADRGYGSMPICGEDNRLKACSPTATSS
jgi:hypothetical protein